MAPNPSRHKAASARSASRLGAIQALYEMEISGATVDRVIKRIVSGQGFSVPELDSNHESDDGVEPDLQFLITLVKGVNDDTATVDRMIGGALPTEWPLERIEILLKNLLRAAVFELHSLGDIPPRVVITEYVELAHDFFDKGEAAMVNGVLDHLAHRLRADAMSPNPGRGNGQ